MRPALGQAQERAVLRPMPELPTSPAAAPTAKEIPYDYVARFKLEGRPGNRVQDVINISIEGAFVAVAIGYSFIPAKLPAPGAAPPPPAIGLTLPVLPAAPDPTVDWLFVNIINPLVEPRMLMKCLLVRLCGIDFKYSIIDSATGRELQNQPIHNIAGLGEASGDRPFRPFAKPMLFLPRSTIRIEVEEIAEGLPSGSPLYGYDDPTTKQRVGAELFIVLHGYKILGYGTALP